MIWRNNYNQVKHTTMQYKKERHTYLASRLLRDVDNNKIDVVVFVQQPLNTINMKKIFKELMKTVCEGQNVLFLLQFWPYVIPIIFPKVNEPKYLTTWDFVESRGLPDMLSKFDDPWVAWKAFIAWGWLLVGWTTWWGEECIVCIIIDSIDCSLRSLL